MTRDRLLDVERTKKPTWTGGVEIVLVARDVCLRCGGDLLEMAYGQLPLFRSHGYGAVRKTTLRVCRDCSAAFIVDVTEVNPRSWTR